ncbi:Uncharacterized protein Fot_25108 [Forsythia ovata]|uniref:Uncharacterized protein n=1 Tax=Forsythia ovata TaxID=205694 RepID=A0ABD1U872_9LAMI
MERVEKWVEHVRGLFGGHEDPESDPIYWACNKYPSELNISDFTKLRDQDRVLNGVRLIFLNKKDRLYSPLEGQVAITSDAFTYGMRFPFHPFFRAILKSYNQPTLGPASALFGAGKLPIQSLGDKEDLEILDEDALKMVKKLRTVSSRFSSHQEWKLGMLPEASTSPTPQEKSKPLAYPEIWHIKKVLEDRPVDIFPAVLNMLSDPASKAVVAVRVLTKGKEKLKADLASSEVDVAEFSKNFDHANQA